MPMDKRIGYGLTLDEALDRAKRIIECIHAESLINFKMKTDNHSLVWGEKRDDGWRIYTNADIISNDSKEEKVK